MLIRPERLTVEAYGTFGDLLSADRSDVRSMSANQGTAIRKNHQIPLQNLRDAAMPNFASFRCSPRTEFPFRIELLEKHPESTQVFIPMNNAGRFLVIVAAEGEAPDLASVRAFVAHGNEAISYRPGTWHHPMIALDHVADFACLVWEDGSPADVCEADLSGDDVWVSAP